MKKNKIVVFAIAIFTLFQINFAEASVRPTRIIKPISIEDDTTFVVPEVDLSQLNTPPRFATVVYKQRLDSITKFIPLDYNPFVQGYIDLYAYRKREQVERMLGLSEYYFPMIERVFKEYKIPAEFKYLAIVESALNPYAVSPVGATGMWQFMFTTAKMYDLKITSHIDERRDPLLATHAAAKYFVDMYRRYGDWLLVIAAYNCGPGNVNRAIRKAGGGQKTFWEIRQFLPQETRGYVPAYIAANYIMSCAEMHNLYPAYPNFSFMTDTLHFSKPVAFKDIVKVCGINNEELKILNPIFKKDFIPAYSESYMVKLPATRRDLVARNIDSLYKLFPQVSSDEEFVLNTDPMAKSRTIFKTHVVKKGETLAKLANKYDVEIRDIKKWNGLSKNALKRGQRIKIKKQLAAPTVVPANAIARNKNVIKLDSDSTVVIAQNTEKQKISYEYVTKKVTKSHKVKRGENLSLIAAKYDVSSADIKKWNKLRSNNLMAGKVLSIKTTEQVKVAKRISKPKSDSPVIISGEEVQAVNTSATEESNTLTASTETKNTTSEMELIKIERIVKYKVRKGDYLSTIAEKNKVSVQDIRTWNNMKRSVVMAGQTLIIKKYDEKLVAKNSAKKEDNLVAKKIPERNSDEKFVFHKVEKGDTLYGIAKKYAWMTVEKIKEINGIKTSDELKAGMILKISKKS